MGLTLAFLWPVVQAWSNWGIEDWDYWAAHHEAARRSLLEYHQLPLWNPWCCGGTDLAAHPGSRVFAITSPLLLLLGAVSGLKLEMLLHAALGLLGLYAVGRQIGLDRFSAWLAPLAYFLGPLYALPVTAGMAWFTSVAFLPWALLFFLRTKAGDLRSGIASSACLVFMVFAGGAYPLAIALLFFGFLAMLDARELGLARTAQRLITLAAFTLLLGAVKLLPSIEFMRDFPREAEQPTGFSVEGLSAGLFGREQRLEAAATQFDGVHAGEFLRGISADYDDVGMYVGPLVAALFAIGVALPWRKHWRFSIALVFFLLLSFGDRLPFGPFQLLHRLPVFESMRFAERYRLVWLLCALLIAGGGLQTLRQWIGARFPGRPYADLAAAAVLLCLSIDLFVLTRPIYQAAFPIAPMEFRASPEFRQIAGLPNYDAGGFVGRPYGQARVYGAWSAHYPAFLMNRGFVRCYESALVPRAPLPMRARRYRGEVHLAGTTGEVSTEFWSPNKLRFRVRAESAGRLVVNQNYYGGWRASDGRPVTSEAGLIAVEVGPGDREIELTYRRDSFVLGAGISAATWIGVVFAIGRSKRTPSG